MLSYVNYTTTHVLQMGVCTAQFLTASNLFVNNVYLWQHFWCPGTSAT